MGFVLKIYLFGLMAMVPSEDGGQLTVLLLDARHGAETTAGHSIDPHQPMVIARAATCSGDCWQEAEARTIVEQSGGSVEPRLEELRKAAGGGGVWLLDREDLALDLGQAAGELSIELASEEGTWWVPRMALIAPEAAKVDRRFLEARDPGALVAGRLRLNEGRVVPYRFVVFDGEIVSLAFPRGGENRPSPIAPQPFADWIKVEIPVEGCEVSLTGKGFAGRTGRRMKLAPAACDGKGVVEVALLNVPAEGGPLPKRSGARPAGDPVGHHFGLYYELSAKPVTERPLPTVASSQKQYRLPSHASDSLLLAGLRMSDWRGSYSLPICPAVLFDEP